MTDGTTATASSAVARINGIPEDEIADFVRRSIAEQSLHPLIRSMNQDVLSADPRRRTAAESALRRIGFL